jgi:uncharacterized protein (TIGR00725 family)
MNISVVGGSICSKKNYQIAERLGELIAQQGWILICAGRTAIMEAVYLAQKKLMIDNLTKREYTPF